MLSEGIAARRGRFSAYLHRDRVNGRLRGRRGARLAAITSGGAIPDNGALQRGRRTGRHGRRNRRRRLRRREHGRRRHAARQHLVAHPAGDHRPVIVEDAHGARADHPFWRGEAPARTAELSAASPRSAEPVSELAPAPSGAAADRAPRRRRGRLAHDQLRPRSRRRGADRRLPRSKRAPSSARCLPPTTVVAERFFDEGGGMQLVIHAPFGGRINKAWGLALRKKFCRSFNFELQAAATDNGINIALAEQHSFPLGDVFRFLSPIDGAGSARTGGACRRRSSARGGDGTRARSLALLRFRGGKKVPIHVQRIQSDDLLASVFPDAAACQENIEGRHPDPESPAGARGDERRPERGDGSRRTEGRARAHRRRPHPLRRRRHAVPSALLARDSERESLRLSRRCAAGGATGARGGDAAGSARNGALGNRPPRSRGDSRGHGRCVAGRSRRRRSPRRAADTDCPAARSWAGRGCRSSRSSRHQDEPDARSSTDERIS